MDAPWGSFHLCAIVDLSEGRMGCSFFFARWNRCVLRRADLKKPLHEERSIVRRAEKCVMVVKFQFQ
jgi:hypothetical protein